MVIAKTIETSQFSIDHEGIHRLCLVMAAPSPRCRRVVISLHGSGFTAQSHAITTDMRHLADRGAVVVMPQAAISFRLGSQWPWGFAWNIPGTPLPGETSLREGPDDPAFIHGLVATCARRYPALPIHLAGYSGGARLASQVIGTDPRPLSAALVAGARAPMPITTRPAILAVHGKRDPINPYEGSDDPRWRDAVPAVVRCWANAAGCLDEPVSRRLAPGIDEDRFHLVDGFSPVRLVSLAHVGHAWPGSADAPHITQFGDPGEWSATRHLASFFADAERMSVTGGGGKQQTDQSAFTNRSA